MASPLEVQELNKEHQFQLIFYHWEFLKPWLENNNTDPLTRQPIQWVIEVPQNIVQNQITANDYDDLVFESLVCENCVSHLWPDVKHEILPE